MLEVSSVSKAFFPNTVNEKVALRGIDLTLDKGDFVTVIGSNGAGKSTLLNIIAGRYRPDSGSVTIDGKDVTKMPDYRVARYVGRVFQDPMAGTAAHMTMEENLSIALSRGHFRGLVRGVSRARRARFRRGRRPPAGVGGHPLRPGRAAVGRTAPGVEPGDGPSHSNPRVLLSTKLHYLDPPTARN